MPLVTSKQLLLDAQKGGYAIGAFNVENMEMVQAVVSAAVELLSPVILQTTPSTLKYADPELFYANAVAVARSVSVPVVIHLDHGSSFSLAMRAYRAGYTSIMIDGSKLPFEDNIKITRQVADACHAGDVPVEAELGMVGGKEDDLVVEGYSPYTDPDEAAQFVEMTQVDSLAVGIGTAHGIYKGEPNVNIARLKEIRAKVNIPLVLHGTSGVQDDVVKECIANGICKVNYATDLRIAFSDGVKDCLHEDASVFDPKKYNSEGRDRVKQCVIARIKLCGSNGKA